MRDNREKIKIVIWGTGGQAGGVINYNEIWLKNVEIVCFVSNGHEIGEPEEFFEKPVIHPQELINYHWDNIVILSSYIEDITRQIVEEMKIDAGKIVTLEMLAKKVVELSGISIFNKKVLAYGKKYDDYAYIYHLKQRVAELKIVSDGENQCAPGVEMVPIEDVLAEEADYVLLLDKTEEEEQALRKKLQQAGLSGLQNVVRLQDWICNLAFEYHKKINDSERFYYSIVPRPRDGLMVLLSEFLRNCEYAIEKGYVPFIDMQNTINTYLDGSQVGTCNAWEYYFKQLSGVPDKTVDKIYGCENVAIPSLFVRINKSRDIVKSKKALHRLRNVYKNYFQIQPEIMKKIENEYERIFANVQEKRVLGAVYRGTDYQNVQPANHMIQPDLEEFIQLCRTFMKEWNCEYLFVATEDEEALERLKDTFPSSLLYTNQLRYKNTGDKFLAEIQNARENDRYLRGLEYLEAVVLLTKCDCLLGGQNGALYGALLMAEKEYDELYVFDKGKYAATNVKYR